ncbi:homoserine kinase [Parasphingorhabdus sp.]|uniref:homoserine kinase n=1 Tax=Parasphingorhabdus sp. TaxID=2709688 RepID=UPI00326418CF
MAVYTQVSAEEIDRFLTRFDVGTLVSVKGIAEGVENSNYLLETTQDKYILTLYEKRVDPADLPFFIALLDHLSAHGCLVPPMIADREGKKIQQLCGRSACLITFLSGVSVSSPTTTHAAAMGEALGDMHRALADFDQERRNVLDHDGWRALAEQCGPAQLDKIAPGLATAIAQELDYLDEHWPHDLPRAAIHADLFPDNVLMLDDKISGLIDFYFSCTDVRAYDLAVTHAAWCFSEDGTDFHDKISQALITGYASTFPISDAERKALPLLARGAALRFLLTRAYDWINTPADALVTRKDPQAFLNRLEYYQTHPDVFAI